MSGRELARYVDVLDADGRAHCFGPGGALPAWAEAKITNPDVWASDAGPDAGDGSEPPRTGKGSGIKAWQTYAETLGVDVDGLDRDGIIDLIDSLDGGTPAAPEDDDE